MSPDEPLQFDTAAPAGTPSANCAACKRPVGDSYYTAGKAIVCESCKTQIESAPRQRPSPALVARAIVYGLGGALLGAGVYYGVLALLHYQISFVAIAVGFIVGRAVHMGAGGQRGRVYQVISLLLTYLGIALGFTSAVFKSIQSLNAFTVIAFPIETTIHDPLMGLIIGIGLWYAWTMNRDPGKPVFQGPFRVGATA